MVSVPLCTVPSAGSSREGRGCAGDGCSEPPQARVQVQPEQTRAVWGQHSRSVTLVGGNPCPVLLLT